MAVELISATGIPVKLDDLISYDPATGSLTWLPRGRELFGTKCAWRTWNARYAGKPALSCSDRTYYKLGAIFNRMYRAHRVAWALTHGDWPDAMIDHIDGDPANNKLSNLRVVSVRENAMNASCRSDTASGALGVSWNKLSRKWEAYINADGRRIRLGMHADIASAKAARKHAERIYGFHKNHGRAQRHAAVAASNCSE